MQFRTKARAVDLLGKGQIADLPTAITELWKNGYDAYADNLSAELYVTGYQGIESPIFIISDDGTGMSQSDILNKWLVLGVDSKSRTGIPDEKGTDTLWKEPRIKAGEKGIGRLSVAFLGSPMLMVTKKQGYSMQAMFFDWRLLENYNMYLDDVEIPVISVDKQNIREQFEGLRSQLKDNILRAVWDEPQIKLRNAIEVSVNQVQLPMFFESQILNDFEREDAHGTKFIIFEPEEQIVNFITQSSRDDDSSNDTEFVRTSLVGFTNLFKPENEQLPIKCYFPVYKESDDKNGVDYFSGQGEFFNEKDYDVADIIIDGQLDGLGAFSGTLTIYGEKITYSYTNPRKKDQRSIYGIVPLKIGYSMGKEKDARLKGETWSRINKKVVRYGGIYIYRDGFRVLPYGRIDADFLELEEKRNRRIGTYFFSYRRMFGYLELGRTTNPLLKDKSSREGLINNAAYRAFKDDLINLFIDLAKEYFSDQAKQSIFLDAKKRMNDASEVIKKDKAREKQEKRLFTMALKEYPQRFKTYKSTYEQTIAALREKVEKTDMLFADIEALLNQLQQLDIQFADLLPQIPKRYKMTETQEDRLYTYSQELETFNKQKHEWADVISAAKARLQIQDLRKDFINQCNSYIAKINEFIDGQKVDYIRKTKALAHDIEERSNRYVSEIESQKEKSLQVIQTREDVNCQLEAVKELYESILTQIGDSIEPLVTHINRLSLDIDEELLQGAYKEQYEKIKNQWELSRETSQLGIAVEIIDHEFNALYSKINELLNHIDEKNTSEEFAYLRKNFKTLEDKYALLSPLYRISGSVNKDIQCADLKAFLIDFFERRLASNGVKLISTKAFDEHVISIKEPVLYSVCINIVNNALYWLQNSEKKIIELAYNSETEEIIIRNSGTPIQDNKLGKIFELFYSNRPNGRGLGLFLAKQSLAENYYDIYATNDYEYNTLNGACFVIKPIKY